MINVCALILEFKKSLMVVFKLLQIISIRMGQENSLNCKNNYKDKQHEVQTTQSNAMHLVRALQSQNEHFQSDIKSKKSATTIISEIQNKTPLRISKAHLKTQQNIIPQHQNLLRVSYTPFEGAQKQGQKWIEKDGKCLAEIIQSRYNTNMHFPQTQVVTLIESLVYILAYLQKGGIKHNDFYPTNIFYCAGIFKLINPVNIQSSAYSLTQQRKRFSFLGPQLIADIVEDTPQNDIPPQILFKSDIFAIGMIILEFTTLQPSAECYDEQNYQLIDAIIKERLVKVAQLYSPKIADCVAQMLVYNVDDRIPVQDLALVVYLNSQSEKVQKTVQQQAVKQQPRGNNLPQLPKPNSPTLQQLRPPQINPNNLPPPYVMTSPGQINPNNIAVPVPNYAYSHIGPNNQSLLSPSSLQNKLRIIEQIHQKPQLQEDSQGQLSSLPSNFGSGNNQIHQIKTQQQIQKQIINGPPPQLQNNQQIQPQLIQQISPQYFQQNQIPSAPQLINPPIRQVFLTPNYQNQLQYLPPNVVNNMPPVVLQGNFIPSTKVVQQNKMSPVIQNLPQSGFKSTQVQSKYEPDPPKTEEQLNNHQYEGVTHPNNYPNYNQKQLNVAQKDHDLFFKPTAKENVQKQSLPTYQKNNYQTANYESYKPPNYSTPKYNFEPNYLSPKDYGNYQSSTAANNYQGTSYKNKYEFTSLTNKYARPRDQNGQTLEQRVDRILQISRSIK